MKKIFFSLLFLGTVTYMYAQEFNCKVTINTPKLQTVDPKVFKTLETAIRDLFNTNKWTEDAFEPYERIACNLTLNIKEEISPTRFSADFAIQARRPVFNSSYETVLFAYSDEEVIFDYEEYQPLEFSQNVFNNNLASIIAFYANVILGIDYDTFSSQGGDVFFQEAQNIVSNIPSNIASTHPGWRSIDGQTNRYWLIENILAPRMIPYRKSLYTYHRGGLDRMAEDSGNAVVACATAIAQIAEANKAYRNTMIVRIFAQTKQTEIIQIFSQAPPDQKRRVYQAMVQIDAANASKYRVIR